FVTESLRERRIPVQLDHALAGRCGAAATYGEGEAGRRLEKARELSARRGARGVGPDGRAGVERERAGVRLEALWAWDDAERRLGCGGRGLRARGNGAERELREERGGGERSEAHRIGARQSAMERARAARRGGRGETTACASPLPVSGD